MKPVLFSICLMLNGLISFADASIAFILNAQNQVSKLTDEEIRDFYLKKKRTWLDGTSVRFIDRQDGLPEKNIFLKQIVKQSIHDIDLFWIQQKESNGNAAPLQIASDSETVELVSHFRGAIGYVSTNYPIPPGVKKIEITTAQ